MSVAVGRPLVESAAGRARGVVNKRCDVRLRLRMPTMSVARTINRVFAGSGSRNVITTSLSGGGNAGFGSGGVLSRPAVSAAAGAGGVARGAGRGGG